MKYIIVLFITLVLMGIYIYTSDTPDPSTKMGRKLIREVAGKLEKRYEMEQILFDEAGDEETYRSMGIGFSIKRLLDKDEGRKILVDCVETFISTINSDPEFKQYMSEYPFTSKNVHISLYISHPDGSDVFYPNVGIFAAYGGKVYYYVEKPDNLNTFHSKEEEPFEEAVRIVAEQQRRS